MPWYRLDDVGYDDPLVLAVGNAAYGALTRMGQYSSAQRTDGWVPASKAREIASRAELRLLTDTRIGADPPALHLAGDECGCLEGRGQVAERGGFWIHAFLDRNPSRSENDVHKAKARELRDKELRRAVKDRDGDRCRYCGITVRWADRKTPAGGVLDHVDPKIAAGADNLVVACRGCNGRKKDCTPEAAGMALLPPPAAAGEGSGTRPGSTPDQPPIYPGSTDPPRNGSETGSRSAPDPAPDPNPGPGDVPGPGPAQNQATDQAINRGIHDGMTAGPGRAGPGRGARTEPGGYARQVGDAGPTGHRPTVGPPTTPRSQLAPNPYTRSPAGQPDRAAVLPPPGGDDP